MRTCVSYGAYVHLVRCVCASRTVRDDKRGQNGASKANNRTKERGFSDFISTFVEPSGASFAMPSDTKASDNPGAAALWEGRCRPTENKNLKPLCRRIVKSMNCFKTYALTLLALLFTACSGSDNGGDDDNPSSGNVTATLTPENIQATAVGGTYSIEVKTTAKEWTAYSSDESVVKVSTSQTTSQTGTITATVTPNQSSSERTATVTFKSGTFRKNVTVKQTAPLSLSTTLISRNSEAGTVDITVSGPSDWTATPSDSWITTTRNDNTLTVSIAANSGNERKGTVTVATADESAEITVTQFASGDAVEVPEGYELVWRDEFNSGTTLSSDWTHERQAAGWVNNELQTYATGAHDGINITEIKDGHLNINCFKASDGKIYSGRVYAKVSTGWKYGYFEARMKLPSGKGTWPAFWMMPVNNDWSSNPWPMCGEIDIMEEVGVVPNEVSSSIHTQDYNHTKNTQKTHAMTISKAEGEYHVYALEWTEDAITTYVDGKVQLAVTKSQLGSSHNQWPFHYAFYPIFNLAFGGSWGGMNGVDYSILNNGGITLEVDYLRIFQKKTK
jgi:beta-glucanase (GH16 family)